MIVNQQKQQQKALVCSSTKPEGIFWTTNRWQNAIITCGTHLVARMCCITIGVILGRLLQAHVEGYTGETEKQKVRH